MRADHQSPDSAASKPKNLLYGNYFGFREQPFSVSPDPRYLCQTQNTQEALASLIYGIESRKGFILLTGEVGTGKTTLLNRLLDWLKEQEIPSAFIFNSQLSIRQLFDFIMADFGIPCESRQKSLMVVALNQWMLERYRSGKTTVLVVDEAQHLSLQVLEQIRLLSNVETSHEKLIQIVLSGQPEFEEKLNLPELRQLRQRIVLHCRTTPLSCEETRAYIAERLRIAGATGEPIFSDEAIVAVHRHSRGIPRVVNLLCEHALINAFADQQRSVLAPSVEEIAREFELNEIAHIASPAPTQAERVFSSAPEGNHGPQSRVPGGRPPEAPYVPPQTDGPGFVLFDDGNPRSPRYLWDQEASTTGSHSKFFGLFVTGAITLAILAAVLFFAYGNPVALLTQWQSTSSPAPAPQTEPATPLPLTVPLPPITSELPSSGSRPEAPGVPVPLPDSADRATAQTATESPSADFPLANGPNPSPRVADPGEGDLALARRYLSQQSPGASVAAARLLWAGVEKGNVEAEISLAELYARGEGVQRSCDQAIVLLRAAAKKGSDEASQKLAQIVRSGCQ